jgi:hypothetical protein
VSGSRIRTSPANLGSGTVFRRPESLPAPAKDSGRDSSAVSSSVRRTNDLALREENVAFVTNRDFNKGSRAANASGRGTETTQHGSVMLPDVPPARSRCRDLCTLRPPPTRPSRFAIGLGPRPSASRARYADGPGSSQLATKTLSVVPNGTFEPGGGFCRTIVLGSSPVRAGLLDSLRSKTSIAASVERE